MKEDMLQSNVLRSIYLCIANTLLNIFLWSKKEKV